MGPRRHVEPLRTDQARTGRARRAGGSRGAAAVLGISAAGVALPIVQLHLARRHPKLPRCEHALDGPLGSGARSPLHIVWMGDSTVAGVGADHPAATLPHQVAARLEGPVHVSVLARSGARVADVLADQLPRLDLLGRRPDLVMISIGANDVAGLTPGPRFSAGYEEMLSRLAGIPVTVLSIPDMGSALLLAEPLRSIAGMRARRLDGRIRAVVARHDQVDYIDIATRPAGVPRGAVGAFLAADRYHPNAAGYGVWATLITAQLAPRLAGRSAPASGGPAWSTAS